MSPLANIFRSKIIFNDVQLKMVETSHQFCVEWLRARPACAAVCAQQIKHARRASEVPTFCVYQYRRDQTRQQANGAANHDLGHGQFFAFKNEQSANDKLPIAYQGKVRK